MALPALQSFEDCADWAKTIEPYIPQLYELPKRFVDVMQGRESLVDIYTQTNPAITGFAISIVLGAIFLVVAEANRNYSQVDRFWSLLPTFFIAHFDLWARLTGAPSSRIDLILFFSTVWSVSNVRCTLQTCHDAKPQHRPVSHITTGEREAILLGARIIDGRSFETKFPAGPFRFSTPLLSRFNRPSSSML